VPARSRFAARLGVRYSRLSLSSAQTRWGSASVDGSIRLNWRLIHFAMPTIDYVVAHELAHLREMNHSPRFWDVVRSVMPDYEQVRGHLKHSVLPVLE
jgi:predicted metal-dependent hydrolase